ncbi:MAG: InlB B-repeat-containing protein [Prevotella sp.]|nr:InlB B-repeat-containing protein [Staphylococcus sp.]MCM1349990.1 InlB B-repeat-containing protein [Prevotella sp.]
MRKIIGYFFSITLLLFLVTSCGEKGKVHIQLNADETLVGSILEEYQGKTTYETILQSATVQKEGYTFRGWSIDGQSIIDEKEEIQKKEIWIYPLFRKNQYTITYQVEGETDIVQTYDYQAPIELPNPPKKEGHTFKAWSETLPNVMPAEDIIVEAVFEKNVYTITYQVEGLPDQVVQYHYGDSIESVENPVLEGYIFQKWNQTIPEVMPAENLVVIALFDSKKYTITYQVEGEEDIVQQYLYNETIVLPNSPEKTGYTFKAWSETLPEVMPAENIIVEAIFEKNTYTITYQVDGEIYKSENYVYQAPIEPIKNPVKTGYTFSSWSIALPEVMPAEDIIAEAIFEKNAYTITYQVDHVEYAKQTYFYQDEIVLPLTPSKKGYIFSGWQLEIPEYMPDQNLVVSGTFDRATYTITYQYDEGRWPLTNLDTIEDVLDALFTDFHTYLNSNVELSRFIKGENGQYQSGEWVKEKSKLYAANLKDIRDQADYFINDIRYHDKWIGFFDTLDACITAINPAQDFWSSTYVGCIRLPEIADHATRFTMDQKEMMRKAYQVEVKPILTYQFGNAFSFLPLSLDDGREFLGWYMDDNLLEGITAEMAQDITVVAKWTEPIFPTEITIENLVSCLDKNQTYLLQYQIQPIDVTHPQLVMTSSEEKVATIEKGTIVTKGYGTTMITIYSVYRPDVRITFELQVFPDIESDKPVIYLPYTTPERLVIYANESYDLREGVLAYDKTDGDISTWITINDDTLDPSKEGIYTVIYSVTDSEQHTITYTREVMVVERSELLFIGHAGCYLGIMNTEEAFINAVTVKGYQALECDVKQTKDGVFVVCHDNDFAGYALASTNYADLKDVTTTVTRGGITYTSKICTFERYLEICKTYGVIAVVELKSSAGITNSDQSRMGALMQVIQDKGMLDQVIFLGSQYKCLEWVRNNGYHNIRCQYLVNSCESETIFNRCLEWRFDVSFNIGYANSEEWIARYHEAGLKVSCYTFSQYSDAATLQSWIDKGVDYVTCDVLTKNDVKVPDRGDENQLPEYLVTFQNPDGTILKEAIVKEGKKAVAPFEPQIAGYRFIGWDKPFDQVREDMTITAQYEIVHYTIAYDANFVQITAASWESKEAFVQDFYTDLFNWLVSHIDQIDQLTVNGSTYTLKMNTTTYGTAVFSSVSDLLLLDKYIVEQTIGQLIYCPIVGTNHADLEMVENEGYFLNTEPYRTKYKALNGYFLKAMQQSYPTYNTNYKPTSAGKVQIFFRFQQWQQGTKIPVFDQLPTKWEVVSSTEMKVTLPTTPVSYTIQDTVILQDASCEGYLFMGWYLDQGCTIKVETIQEGTTGNLKLYAKWQKITE